MKLVLRPPCTASAQCVFSWSSQSLNACSPACSIQNRVLRICITDTQCTISLKLHCLRYNRVTNERKISYFRVEVCVIMPLQRCCICRFSGKIDRTYPTAEIEEEFLSIFIVHRQVNRRQLGGLVNPVLRYCPASLNPMHYAPTYPRLH